jgi:hypothetical protein
MFHFFSGGVPQNIFKRASLDLNFAKTKSLLSARGVNHFTFTRASSATFFDASKVMQTAASDEPRFDHDPFTGESLGLLIEESRTQLLEQTDTLATQTKTVTAVAHTLSFYGTGTVVLSGAHSATVVGTGGYPNRRTLTFTPTAGNLTLTVTGTVQFGQLEAGLFCTSYIRNTGNGQVTRAADVAPIFTAGGNFTSWYQATEGTVFVDVSTPSTYSQTPTSVGIAWSISDNTFNETVYLGLITPAQANATILTYRDNSATQASLTLPPYIPGTRRAVAFAYRVNDFSAAVGTTLATDTAGSINTVNRAYIGANWLGTANYVNGHIRRFTYWPQRLPDSLLQKVSQ